MNNASSAPRNALTGLAHHPLTQVDLRAVVLRLVRAIEAKDLYTLDHSASVADLAERLARAAGLSAAAVEQVYLAAHLHDIGKIGIPDGILLKNGLYTPAEYAIMKEHPRIGFEILKNVAGLEAVAEMVLHHHERFDGSGYPDLLRGDEIPVGARVLTIADSFDAMTSQRSYKPMLSAAMAAEELRRESGRQFDPTLVTCFLEHVWLA